MTIEEKRNDYDGFLEKFKPKKTTDDCYTPPAVYDAVRQWVNDNILPLDGVEIVRPFYPGGDYENHQYPEGCIVLDNPPFSILSKIRRFYHQRGIRYFLFCPSTCCANSARELPGCYILTGNDIIYENGATVGTSFITNLDCSGTRIWIAGDLSKAIDRANQKPSKAKPRMSYPVHVISPAIAQKIAKRGIILRIDADSCTSINGLDAQRPHKKSLYGGGWLLSERAAAERAAAERAAAEPEYTWLLSQREKDIISTLK